MVSWRLEKEVFTELTLFGGSCDFDVASVTMEMMPQFCHCDDLDQVQKEVSTELTLSCGSQKESIVSWGPENGVSTELTFSSGADREFQKRAIYKRKASEISDSDVMKPKCHREYSDEARNDVSTESTLSCRFQKESSKKSMVSWGPESSAVSTELAHSFGFQKEFSSKESMVSWDHENGVSTELTLSCGFQPRVLNKRKTSEKINDPYSKQKKTIEKTAAGSKEESSVTVPPNKDEQDHQEERTPWVSEDSWGLKKKLTAVDLSKRDRLVLPTRLVYILPFLNVDSFDNVVESKAGMPVTVWDQDSQSEHQFVLKMKYTYALHGNWHEDFWVRRGLKKNDVIGLSWDSDNSRFIFCVLERSRSRQSTLKNVSPGTTSNIHAGVQGDGTA